MSAHNHAAMGYRASVTIPDPGSGGTITVEKSPCLVNLVTTGAQTRTLARPTRAGAEVILHAKTIVTSCTITPTGGLNEYGDTTIVFSNAGEFAVLKSFYDGSSYFWRVVTSHIIGNLVGLTATVAELNQAADESANVEVVITTNVIAASESGKTFFLDLIDGFTSTLPAPAAGLRFRFIVKTAPTTAYIIVTTSSANIMYGMMLERAGGAGVAGAARDRFDFVASQAIIGDWVEFYSDGTNWYYHGMVDVAAGNTVAQSA